MFHEIYYFLLFTTSISMEIKKPKKPFPKSSTNLRQLKHRRYPKRESTLQLQHQQKHVDFKMENPIRVDQTGNFLPDALKNQLSQCQYITANSIKKIEFPQSRRTSSFIKNLQSMQEVVKRQEEKFLGMIKPQVQGGYFQPMRINEEDDRVSLQLNGIYDYKERIDDFDIFRDDDDMEEEQVIFYSNQDTGEKMDEEVDDYLS